MRGAVATLAGLTAAAAALLVLLTLIPAPASSAETGHDIAVLGCSNTEQTARAYVAAGGERMHPRVSVGGDYWRWQNPTFRGWRKFDRQLHPGITVLWWQLCTQADNVRADYQTEVSDVLSLALSAIAAQGGNVQHVYVSALNEYAPGYPRYESYLATVEMRDWMLANLDVEAGPVMPLLTADKLEGDDIHPNAQGEAEAAAALLAFFS